MNRFYVRKFLNRSGHHGGAYVLAIVERSTPEDDVNEYREISLEISDCYRHINLDFPMSTASQRANSVRKARILADVLAEFADAIDAEAELEAERSRRTSR